MGETPLSPIDNDTIYDELLQIYQPRYTNPKQILNYQINELVRKGKTQEEAIIILYEKEGKRVTEKQRAALMRKKVREGRSRSGAGFKPIFSIETKDEEYPRIASLVGLPRLAPGIETDWWKLWKPTRGKSELLLWQNESVKIIHDDLWANMGFWKNSSKEIEWALNYQTKYGPLIPISRKSPLPHKGIKVAKTFYLRCTNNRLVSYREKTVPGIVSPKIKGYVVIHFPWSMLHQIKSIPYEKRFFSEDSYYLELRFSLGSARVRMTYFLVFGSLSSSEAISYARTIHETALKAKIRWAESVGKVAASAEIVDKAHELANDLRRGLEGKNPEDAKITVAKDSVFAHQVFLPDLNPFDYYKRMRSLSK